MGFEIPPGAPDEAEPLPGVLTARVEQSVDAFKKALGPIAAFMTTEQLELYRREVSAVATFSYSAGYRAASRRGVRT